MIQRWLTKRRERKTAEMLARKIPLVLARLGELIEKHPASFMDEKWLPLDKPSMKTVLKIAIAAERDPSKVEWLRTGWMMLAQFQPNIGDAPVTWPNASTPDEMLAPETLAALERFTTVSKAVTEESARTLVEIRQYVASLPAKET